MRAEGDRLLLSRVAPAAGTRAEVTDRGADRVQVEFEPVSDDGPGCRVRAELEGGRIAWRVEEDR